MVTACIVLLYISYAIPVTCLLIRGRNSISHGPFWLGKFGLVANLVLLLWMLFTFVMYSFPIFRPVQAGSKFAFHFSASSPFAPCRPFLPYSSFTPLLPCERFSANKVNLSTI